MSLLIMVALCVAVLVGGSLQSGSEYDECLIRDYLSGNRIYIKHKNDSNVPLRVYTHSRTDPNGENVTIYFTPCGNLPKLIRDRCGIDKDNKEPHTLIEMVSGEKLRCIQRKKSEIVTSKYVKSAKEERFDILYSEPGGSELIIMKFLIKAVANTSKVEYRHSHKTQFLNQKAAHIYEAEIEAEVIDTSLIYLIFSNRPIIKIIFGVIYAIVLVLCTFYYNYLSSVKRFYPFNFFINFFVSYRLSDYIIQIFYFPWGSQTFTTAYICIVPLVSGLILQKLGPAFTYRKTMYLFYALCMADVLLVYTLISNWILALGLLHVIVTIVIVKVPRIAQTITDGEEWTVSVFIALNLFSMITHTIAPVKNYGAVRLLIAGGSEFYANSYLWVWILLSFFLIPMLAYLRYKFSDSLIQQHYEKITDKMDTILRLTKDVSLLDHNSNSGDGEISG